MKALPLVLLSLCFSMNTAVAAEDWDINLAEYYDKMSKESRQAFIKGLTIGYEAGMTDGYAIRDKGDGSAENIRQTTLRVLNLPWKRTKEIVDWCRMEGNAFLVPMSEIIQEIANGGTNNDIKRRLLDKQDSKEKALLNSAK